MNNLILAYPGSGIRTLLRSDPTVHGMHLDAFGRFDGSYFKWVVDPNRVIRYLNRHPDTQMAGFCSNWAEISSLPCWDQVQLYVIPPSMYHAYVLAYRTTKEYELVDRTILDSFGEDDLTPDRHLQLYIDWCVEAGKFFDKLNRERHGKGAK